MISLQEKQLNKEKYSFYYYTAGNPQKETLVFIHPAYGDHTCFHHQMEAFFEDYYLIFVDMLGHGKSQVPMGGDTIEKTADLVVEILDKEDLKQAHLIGVSLGSLMAQYIAHKYPERVKSVTITGGYSIFGDNSKISKAQNREIGKAFFLMMFNMEGFRRYVVKSTNIVPAEQEIFYLAMKKFTRKSLPVMQGMQKILDKSPRSIIQPLLIVVGEYDLPVILENAKIWQKHEPNATFRIIPDAGHCANMDNPAVFNREFKTFIEMS
ncbi:MAG: alpha/beta hydrolase [Anaerolineaceae bacterium]|nr:alpha/beta hydrolase [Anaerolineaceae bacterium]